MPKINFYQTLDVSPEKYLQACSDTELQELDLLLDRELRIRKSKSPKPHKSKKLKP